MTNAARAAFGLGLILFGVAWLWLVNPTYDQMYGWAALFVSVMLAIGAIIIAIGVCLTIPRRDAT